METQTELVKGISPSLVQKYLHRLTSPAEDLQILDWLQQSDDNPRYMAEMMANLSLHETISNPTLEDSRDRMCARLNARIDADATNVVRRRHSFARMSWAAVSAVAIVLAVGLTWFIGTLDMPAPSQVAEAVAMNRHSNNSTTTETVVLEDKTKIYLKPGSTLEYNLASLADRREIMLDGEAYFDVAKDSLRPLMVHTRNIGVKVLGTAFSVRSSFTSPNTEVMLERGSVRIMNSEGTNIINLSPGQKAVYDEEESVLIVKETSAKAYMAEHYSLVRMDGVTVAEIVQSLQNDFGVKIRIRGTQNTTRYYFNYLKTDSVEDILTVLEFISGTRCDII